LDAVRALHSLFQYPARFPPHIVDAVMRSVNGRFVDPFAGSGTVPVHGYLVGRDADGYDLLPIIQLLVDAKVSVASKQVDADSVEEQLLSIDDDECSEPWLLRWWHPGTVSLACGLLKLIRSAVTVDGCSVKTDRPVLVLTAMHAMRRISLADTVSYKWSRSARKLAEISRLVELGKVRQRYRQTVRRKLNAVRRLMDVLPEPETSDYSAQGCSDALSAKWKADALLTSPPYLGAHEYVRSFRYELLTLGLPDSELRRLRSLEIPYRKVSCEWSGELYRRYLECAGGSELYRRYFCAMFLFLSNVYAGTVALLTGPASVNGVRVPIHEILGEFLSSIGYKEVRRVHDKIRSRRGVWKGGTIPEEVLTVYELHR